MSRIIVHPASNNLRIGATLANGHLAGLLQEEEVAPMLLIERIFHTVDGIPADHGHDLHYRSNALQYKIQEKCVSIAARPSVVPSQA